MSDTSPQTLADIKALTESLLRRASDRGAMHSAIYNVLYDENLPQEVRTALAVVLRDTEEPLGDNLRLTAAEIASQ